jgi:hypothetical protein
VIRFQALPESLFAYRLAAKLGTADVKSLADSLTEEEWRKWQAVAIIDGWANGWSQTAEIIAQLNNQTNRMELTQVSDPQTHHKKQTWLSGSEVARQLTDFKKPKKKKMNFKLLAQQLEAREAAK